MALAVVALVAGSAPPARADTLPIVENLPATYTPGQSFSFQLGLPQLYEFTGYTLQLNLETQVQNPALGVSGAAATSNYPFAASTSFQSSTGTTIDGSGVTLTISDSVAEPGVTVTPPSTGIAGSNYSLATVTVSPGASLTGPIALSVDPSSVFFYNTEFGSYNTPANIPPIDQATTGSPAPVPAPAGAVLLGVGGLVLALRRFAGL
jgi:hypothetical protein